MQQTGLHQAAFLASQGGLTQLTHAILHHHEAALVSLKALAFEAARGVHTDATPAEVRRDPALIDVYSPRSRKEEKHKRRIRGCWRDGAFHGRVPHF